jgi:DNA-binding transcriptional ArsR family regulator
MTDQERDEFDAEPLWTDQEQVLWLLERHCDRDELLFTSKIATELKLQQPAAAHALRQLEADSKVRSRRVGNRELWGTTNQFTRLDRARRQQDAEQAARRAAIVDRNKRLLEIHDQLATVLGERDIAVTNADRMFPVRSEEPYPDHLIIHVSDPEDGLWLLGRLRQPAPDEGKPTDEQWDAFAEELDLLLGSLDWAGWESEEDGYWTDYDRTHGPTLHTRLQRTCMAFEVEYEPTKGILRFRPHEDVIGEWPEIFSMLDAEIVFDLGDDDTEQRAETVRQRAGALGLLDPTRLHIDDDNATSLGEFMSTQHVRWIFEEAADERDIPVEQLLTEIQENQKLSTYLTAVVGFLGQNVLPDCVPDAASIGIAAWCWRNDTAVEKWHLPDDVLMARVNMAVTAAVQPHVDPYEGVDWGGIRQTLTDPSWALPDGRVIAELFGEGWAEVTATVTAQLDTWQHIDEHLLGAHATLRLLSIGGATGHTRHWWGQGRWPAICHDIITEAVQAGITPPAPYDERGPEALEADLADPQHLDDTVLNWLIDMPDGGVNRPRGVRSHPATQPPIQTIDPYDADLED